MADTIHTQPELSDDELLRVYGLAKRDHNYEGPIDDWPKRAERAATVAGLRAAIAADRATLRAARRPKPPSLKEQALEALDSATYQPGTDFKQIDPTRSAILRRALEALPDD